MCRKLCFLMTFVLVLGLVSNASAGDWGAYWFDTDGLVTGNHRWDNADNWDTPDDTPDADRPAMIGYHTDINDADGWPLIEDGVDAVCYYIEVGCDWVLGQEGPCKLYMTGGTFTIPQEEQQFCLTRYHHSPSTIEMSGGTMTIGGWMYVGREGPGTLNMSNDSVLDTGDGIRIGSPFGGDECLMTMSDEAAATCSELVVGQTGNGTFTTTGGTMKASGELRASGGSGTGRVNLYGGTITCGCLHRNSMSGEGSKIDITEGTLIINGDNTELIDEWVSNGWITAYDGNGTIDVEIIDANTVVTAVASSPLARNPYPDDRAEGVARNVVLSWLPGDYAASHDVYLGTDKGAVNDANNSWPEWPDSVYRGNQPVDSNSYTPPEAPLELGQTYYWRIDEVNDTCAPYLWKGPVWSFTVIEYILVDDMEDYNDVSNPIADTWEDGTTNGTGSKVTIEKGTVHEGTQSMNYVYDNNGFGGAAYYSEIEREYGSTDPDRDWTRGGVKALDIWFYGKADNDISEQMYVKLEDANSSHKVPYDGDANDLKDEVWQVWRIDLQAFGNAGVNLDSIVKVTIGFGDTAATQPGGKGTVLFDDIRLYPSRCLLGKPDADLNGDCVVDFKDFTVFAKSWLEEWER